MSKRVLHIFPFSHFSEKGMWILDYKGVLYETREGLDPFVRQRTARLTGGSSTLPVFEDGSTVVPDTTDLALYADRHFPDPPLVPADEPARRECLLIEDWADEVLGEHARRWLFAHVAYENPELARKLFDKFPVPTSIAMMGFPLIKLVMTQMLGLTSTSAAESAEVLHNALKLLDDKLDDGRSYLVANRFTLADLAVCALLSPLYDRPKWMRAYPRVFDWRSGICKQHGRRTLLTDPVPPAAERQRRGKAASTANAA